MTSSLLITPGAGAEEMDLRPWAPRAPQPTTTVVIPALNEAKNLPHVLRRLPACVDEVVLVDGNSSDDTSRSPSACARHPHRASDGRGKGNALACGFAAAPATSSSCSTPTGRPTRPRSRCSSRRSWRAPTWPRARASPGRRERRHYGLRRPATGAPSRVNLLYGGVSPTLLRLHRLLATLSPGHERGLRRLRSRDADHGPRGTRSSRGERGPQRGKADAPRREQPAPRGVMADGCWRTLLAGALPPPRSRGAGRGVRDRASGAYGHRTATFLAVTDRIPGSG